MRDRNSHQQDITKGLKKEIHAEYQHHPSSEKTCFISTELREQSNIMVSPHY